MNPALPSSSSPVERLTALLLLLFFAPVFLEIALVILVSGGRPLLFTSDLTSDAGTTRLRYRFRTTGPGTAEFPLIGQFLRKYALDQLPGLWNVVCGDLKLKAALPRTNR